ncbi:MAG: hypothetical protein ACOYL3_10175 [Desulfuromonadaceae bacterium]
MGTCGYCGQDAGFFRKQHDECQQKFDRGLSQMVSLASNVARTGNGLQTLEQQLNGIAGALSPVRVNTRQALIRGWEQAVESILSDNVLTASEEAQVMTFVQQFGLDQAELNSNGAFTRLAYGCALRDVLEKGTTSRAVITFQLPFNLQKGESLVWCFRNVACYEEKIYKQRVGNSHGVSFRVMSGVYYRVGQSKGYTQETSKTEQVDTGILGVTTEHIYFAGQKKSFRIPYKKIVSFTPFSDGIGICKDTANAKQQTFITGEGWFIYNLVMNLSQRV